MQRILVKILINDKCNKQYSKTKKFNRNTNKKITKISKIHTTTL